MRFLQLTLPALPACCACRYDRPCIERWLSQGNRSCPATGQPLAEPVQLVPNLALRNSIEEWAEKHAPWLLVRPARAAGSRRSQRCSRSHAWQRDCPVAAPSAAQRPGPPSRRRGRMARASNLHAQHAVSASRCVCLLWVALLPALQPCAPNLSTLPHPTLPGPVPPRPPPQDRHRRVKPVPREDQFGAAAPSAGAAGDRDRALAIRLQQEELERLAAQRASTLGAGAAAARSAPGTHASRPDLAGPHSARRVPSRQQLAPTGPPPHGYGVQPGAAAPARRSTCLNLTTLLLAATTVAWVALYIVSLADNGWSLGGCCAGGGRGRITAPQQPRGAAPRSCLAGLFCVQVGAAEPGLPAPLSALPWPHGPCCTMPPRRRLVAQPLGGARPVVAAGGGGAGGLSGDGGRPMVAPLQLALCQRGGHTGATGSGTTAAAALSRRQGGLPDLLHQSPGAGAFDSPPPRRRPPTPRSAFSHRSCCST